MNRILITVLVFLFHAGNAFAQIKLLPQPGIPINSHPEVVTIDDVNNDGLNDVIVGNGFYFSPGVDKMLMVYTQNSQHTLNAPVLYPYSGNFSLVSSICVGQMNSDTLRDVVIGYGDSVGIFYQNNSGTLDPLVSYYGGSSVEGVKTGDLNNDGLQDIAVSVLGPNSLKVLLQSASGGFVSQSYATTLQTGGEIDVADLNGDNLDDVAVVTGGGMGNGIYVFTQNTSGTLNAPVSYPGTGSYNGLAIADLNGDGLNDIVACGGGNQPLTWLNIRYQNATTHLLQSPVVINTYDIPEAVEVADLDCDGDQEIVLGHNGWSAISVFTKNSAGSYSGYALTQIQYTNPSAYSLSIGDMNGDGRKDIARVDYNYGLGVVLNKSIGANATITTTTAIDTFYVSNSPWMAYKSTVTDLDTIGNLLVVRVDTFQHTIRYVYDSIRHDTTVIASSTICNNAVTDTFYYSRKFEVSYQDTLSFLIGTFIDSMLLDISGPGPGRVGLYPNPASAILHIALENEGPLYAEVLDAAGRRVVAARLRYPYVLDTHPLPRGHYNLRITGRQGQRQEGRFIKR